MRSFKTVLSVFLVFVFCLSCLTFVSPKVEAYGETFFIDVGHGGQDPGAVGPGGREEATDVLNLSLRVAELIAPYTTYKLSRTTPLSSSTDFTLSERSSMANNNGAKYCISIHRNSFENSAAKGLEVWWSEWTQSYNTTACINFAQSVYDNVMEQVPVFTRRGLKSGVKLHMTTYPKMPSCLIETGFISNDEDNRIFDQYFEEIALGIANGMLAMIGKKVDGSALETWVEKAAFDVMVYRDRNPDIAHYTDAELKKHWLESGIKEGRASSPVLDLGFYYGNNKDLQECFGEDYEKLYDHFINHGYKEQRKSSALFDGKYYCENYPDIHAEYGDEYMRHYVETGIKEGRRASITFHADYYWFIRPDVWEAWPAHYEMCAKHYAGHGIREEEVAYDHIAPVISDVKVTNISANGYTVTCKVTDDWGVGNVAFPTWTVANNQDDLAANFFETQQGTKDGDTYTFVVKASEHNNEGGAYLTHIYATDLGGNRVSYTLDEIDVKDGVSDDTVITPEPNPTFDVITLSTNSSYTTEGTLLNNVKINTSVHSLLGQFKNESLEVVNTAGEVVTGSAIIGTGAQINLYVNGELVDSLTVVVLGDIDGSGNIDNTDYIRIKSSFLSDFFLSEAECSAADIDNSEVIDSTDYMKVKSHFLGQNTIA